MTTWEPDSDMIRWGLHLVFDPPFNYIYPITINQNGISIDKDQFIKEGSIREDCTSLMNDEIIAHTLQEELSLADLAEASGQSLETAEQSQASLGQNWSKLFTGNSNLGLERPPEAANHMGSSDSYFKQLQTLQDGEEYLFELRDDHSSINVEVCKRLNSMTPVPHVPKINGEIPSKDEAISDHQRLLNRLKLYDLVDLKVEGDGNCQFRALSDQLYHTPEHHYFVRQHIVNQLRSHPEMYEGYVPMQYDDYLNKMSKNGEWGDHVTLQAVADLYGVRIFILTSFKDTCYIEILPSVQKSQRVICLSFWAEVHYNSIYPEGDAGKASKKSWWW